MCSRKSYHPIWVRRCRPQQCIRLSPLTPCKFICPKFGASFEEKQDLSAVENIKFSPARKTFSLFCPYKKSQSTVCQHPTSASMLQYLGVPLPLLQYTPLLSLLLFQWVLNGVNDRVAAASVAVVTTPTTQVAMEKEWGGDSNCAKKGIQPWGTIGTKRAAVTALYDGTLSPSSSLPPPFPPSYTYTTGESMGMAVGGGFERGSEKQKKAREERERERDKMFSMQISGVPPEDHPIHIHFTPTFLPPPSRHHQ